MAPNMVKEFRDFRRLKHRVHPVLLRHAVLLFDVLVVPMMSQRLKCSIAKSCRPGMKPPAAFEEL